MSQYSARQYITIKTSFSKKQTGHIKNIKTLTRIFLIPVRQSKTCRRAKKILGLRENIA